MSKPSFVRNNSSGHFFEKLQIMQWMSDAECAKAGFPERWFWSSWNDMNKAVCSECPVLKECRALNDRMETLDDGTQKTRAQLFGYFAGETPSERHKRRKGKKYPYVD